MNVIHEQAERLHTKIMEQAEFFPQSIEVIMTVEIVTQSG